VLPEAARRSIPRRALDALVAGASVAAVVAAIGAIRPGHAAAASVLVAAMALGAAPFVLLFAAGGGPGAPRGGTEGAAGPGAARRTVTTVVRVGGEPAELIQACLILATRQGRTVVVTATRADLPELLAPLAVPVFAGPTVEEALRDAVATIESPAILVVQPSALPDLTACEAAAARLRGQTGWAVGSVRSFGGDDYAPDLRDVLGARLRATTRRRGLTLWEPDATLVRTDLLRAHPMEPGRPWGAWLRALRAHGYEGADAEALALRVAPSGAQVFWPATISRQRALGADLGDAAGRGSVRSRVLALALLLRELYAYPFGVWLLAPLLVAVDPAFPFRIPAPVFLAVVAALAAARGALLRAHSGVGFHPLLELVAAAFDAPGSLRALAGALRRRLTPARVALSPRPLVWAALALTVSSVLTLVGRPAGAGLDPAAALAVVELVLLWLLALRLIAQRHWDRRVARAPLEVPAVVDGHAGSTVDASPSGLAVAVDLGREPVGATASVSLAFPGQPAFATAGVIADRRTVGRREIVGLALQLDPDERVRWVRQAFDQLHLDRPGARFPPTRPAPVAERRGGRRGERAVRLADRAAIALVAAVSVVVLLLLALAVLGYRPLVVSSGSMSPTLSVGDLVVVDDVRADQIRVGDVVTFTDRDGTTVTHRVVARTPAPGTIRFETRGDANATSEQWSRPPGAELGRLRVRIPAVGFLAGWLRAPAAPWAFLGLALGVAALGAARSVLAARGRACPPPAGMVA
jgi:signal peptidase